MKAEIASKTVKDLTDQELDEIIAQRKRKAQQVKEKREKAYQDAKNGLILELVKSAINVNELLKEFKEQSFSELKEHYTRMKEFGEVKSNHKGNFQLKSNDGLYKVEFSNQVIKEFDERAELAAQHLDEFLLTHVKKKDAEMYEYVKGLSEKKNDKFDMKLVGRLFSMEDKFDHPLWKKAIELFKASYVEVDSAQYVRFFKRNPQNDKFDSINLNFASV